MTPYRKRYKVNTLGYAIVYRAYEHFGNCVVCGARVDPGYIACVPHNDNWNNWRLGKIITYTDYYIEWYTDLAANRKRLDRWLSSG